MKGLSSMQRTLKAMRADGRICGITEYWNAFSKTKCDLFGFVDILALDLTGKIIAVQATTGNCHRGHIKKINDERNEIAKSSLLAGGFIELWSWRHVKIKRGMKATKCLPRITDITIENNELIFNERKNNAKLNR